MDDYKKLRANAKKAILDHLAGYSDTELRNWAAGKSVLASHDIQWFVELIFDLRRLQRQHTPASDGTYIEPSTGERVSTPKKEVVQDTEVERLRKDNEDLHERISSLLQSSRKLREENESLRTIRTSDKMTALGYAAPGTYHIEPYPEGTINQAEQELVKTKENSPHVMVHKTLWSQTLEASTKLKKIVDALKEFHNCIHPDSGPVFIRAVQDILEER